METFLWSCESAPADIWRSLSSAAELSAREEHTHHQSCRSRAQLDWEGTISEQRTWAIFAFLASLGLPPDFFLSIWCRWTQPRSSSASLKQGHKLLSAVELWTDLPPQHSQTTENMCVCVWTKISAHHSRR